MEPVRKIKPGYANLTARVPSSKMIKMINAESSLERDLIALLEFDPKVVEYCEQPLSIPLPNGRTYKPDFYVKYINPDGTEEVFIYEVKYRDELKKSFDTLKPKFKAAITFCKLNNYRFKILTDLEIRTHRLKNIEFLQHFSRSVAPNEDEIRTTLAQSLFELKQTTPEELLAYSFQDFLLKAQATPVMWRMIAEGSIQADLDYTLNMKSPLTLDPEIEEKYVY
ncbi:TnsA endonuclease N-terminal domain-containing protein [Pseudoalteromonas luteoviolacea]|uniref:TnsA endonuclease N-terminal domain-containing protein n=1 Tax=Pseudoalteromonas luteoviolacea TaxID=43657 RepID=UPI001F4354F3|nr:TnsA endonuclease N-terminal domain-containing protein [Pseudoalteromonas luteoviolacea]MCF6441043.1 TnsA endonuclease N-terminal domain-containing protein [Pseudoalteromonas luteoviolacea]